MIREEIIKFSVDITSFLSDLLHYLWITTTIKMHFRIFIKTRQFQYVIRNSNELAKTICIILSAEEIKMKNY